MTTTQIHSRPQPTAQPFDRYLRGNAIANTLQQLVVVLVFAGLATSRASSHVLSGAAICGIVTVAAAGSTVLAFTNNLYLGAFDGHMGAVTFDDDPAPLVADPFTARRFWGRTLLWSLGAAAWAAAGGGLVAAVLNGRVVRFPVMFCALALLGEAHVLAIGYAARRLGLSAIHTPAETTTPLRRRAWLHLALPLGVLWGLFQAGVAWLLFHGYPTGNAAVPGVLTDKTALADALLVVVIMTALFVGITAYWGSLDRMSGRVTLDDPEAQAVPRRAPIGVQVMVYMSIFGFMLFKVAGLVLPATPSLTAVIVIRGLLSAVLVTLAVGIGFVRGACNEVTE